MRAIRIASIVEGDGEVQAVPVLLRRLVTGLDDECWADVNTPLRLPRGKLVQPGELERYVELGARSVGAGGAILVLADADDDCAATLGPQLLRRAAAQRSDMPVGVVLAVREYEAWFLASAASLSGKRGLGHDLQSPEKPEQIRDAKRWLQDHRVDGLAYRPILDQPALTAVLDLNVARMGSPSFDKLCREVERLIGATA